MLCSSFIYVVENVITFAEMKSTVVENKSPSGSKITGSEMVVVVVLIIFHSTSVVFIFIRWKSMGGAVRVDRRKSVFLTILVCVVFLAMAWGGGGAAFLKPQFNVFINYPGWTEDGFSIS